VLCRGQELATQCCKASTVRGHARRIYSHFVRAADMEQPTAAMDTDDEAEAAAAAAVQQQARAAARQRPARLLQRPFR
jgi:hypothetical protein